MEASSIECAHEEFRADLLLLTAWMREQFELVIVEDTFEIVNEWKYGRIVLGNKYVHVKFLAGAPREQFVAVSIHQIVGESDVSKQGLNIKAFASCLGVREHFFPESGTGDCKSRFCYFGSPFQLLASVVFMSSHCTQLFNGNRTIEECRTKR